jgi:uncharacterized membrane protein
VVVAAGGWLVTAPFHLRFHPPFQGIDRVFAWTLPLELFLWGGTILLPVFAAAWVLLVKVLGGDKVRVVASAIAVVAGVVVAAAASGRPTLVILTSTLIVLVLSVLEGGHWPLRPAVALAALGVFLLVVPEVLYVVDSYGDKMHRMNTIFKSYIQAWVFLAAGMPALVAVGLRRPVIRRVALAAICLASLPHLVGMAAQPLTGKRIGLDGLAWLEDGDRAIVSYLRQQPSETVMVEAVGGAYTEFARLSSASGVPTVMGWANHEMVWRGHQVRGETDRRTLLVNRIYRSTDRREIRDLVQAEGVDLVAIGSLERRGFPPESLQAIRESGDVVLEAHGAYVVRFPRSGS